MAKQSPFAGKKLTEQAAGATVGLDQRLFGATSAPPTATQPSPSRLTSPDLLTDTASGAASMRPAMATSEDAGASGSRHQDSLLVGKEGSREGGKEASQPGSREIGKLFDLSDKPARKDSFLFTDEEFEAMDDMKLDLRRTHALKATKNDLARCGLGYLFDDYKRRGDQSELVRRLRQKRVNE